MKQPQTFSIKKRIGFTFLMVAIPFLLLILIELGLHLGNYGGDLDLFIKKKSGSVSEYVLNTNVTKRYFFREGVKTPTPNPNSQTFSVKKDSLTYRIFCLGASTTQGFPYPPSASFPAMLKNILSTLHPEKNFEVINCGITAITSHSVLDMGREVLNKYQPDLIILYTGHNEFYGALGQASRLSLFESRTMIRAFLKLQRSRLFLLLRNTIIRLFGERVTRDSVIDHSTLMGTVAKDISIPYQSALFQRTLNHFRNNLSEIIEEAEKHKTDIIVSTLVANLDFEPFGSVHSESFTKEDTTRWLGIVKEAEALQQNGKFQAAVSKYLSALQMDSSYAKTHFQLAECYRAMRNNQLASKHYNLALNFDPVRFRAPSVFNDIIREAGEKYSVPIVDAEKEFSKASPYGLVGENLILEHIHPNQLGYFRIGKAIAQTMWEHEMLVEDWDWRNIENDSTYLKMSQLTDLDHEVVNYTIFRLTSHWPFKVEGGERTYTRVGNERTEQIARALIDDEEGSLVKSHLDLGLEFYNNNDLDKALAEYLAALAIEPVCETYSRIGLLYTRKTEMASRRDKDYQAASNNFRKAISFFKQGLERCREHVSLNFNFGLLYALRNDHLEQASACFETVLEAEPEHKNALLHLGQIYIRQNEYDKAESFLLDALAIFPEESEFNKNLGLVYARMNNEPEAKKYLNKAIAINPADAFAKHYLNQLNAKIKKADNF